MNITYQLEPGLSEEEFVDLLVRSSLAERRPVGEVETIRVFPLNFPCGCGEVFGHL